MGSNSDTVIGSAVGSAGNPFLDPILARWRETPHALFGVFYESETWREVDLAGFMDRACQFAALLNQAGVSEKDVVLIVLEHGLNAHAAFIGTMLTGAVPGFIPSPKVRQEAELYWRQHRDVFAHTRPRILLVDDALVELVAAAAVGCGAVVIGVDAVEPMPKEAPFHVPAADMIALLQHSSGTTGLKKGVQLSYEAIAAQITAYRTALGLTDVETSRFASWLPLYHDMGLISSFLMPLWLGIPIVSVDPFEWTRRPAIMWDAVQAYKATHMWVPNFALLHHVRSARGSQQWDLSSLRAIIGCSEPNKPDAFDAFERRFASWGVTSATLQTCYAMAETVFAVAQTRVGTPVRRLAVDRLALQGEGRILPAEVGAEQIVLLTNGRPVEGCDLRIWKDGGFVVDDVVGEICIRATFLFSGYFNNPSATKASFQDGFFRSGDLGFIDGGELFIVGRLKDVIIVNGKNIVAHDVEAAASRVSHVKPGRTVAFGFYVAALGSEQLVLVAERNETETDAAAVRRLINHAVAEEVGVTCGDIRLVEQGWLVKTTSGKISRSENEKKYRLTFKSGISDA